MSKAEERAFNEVVLNESRKYYPTSQKMSDEEKEMYAVKQVAFQVGLKAGVKWNEEELTDFENAMLHVGNSFFGKDAGLNPNNTNEVKKQAKLLQELVSKQEWSEENEDFINMLILHFNSLIDKGGDSAETYKSYREKLKSVRPQLYTVSIKDANKFAELEYERGVKDGLGHHWKPSKEQIGALNYAYCKLFKRKDVGHNILGPLQKLCDELKKLM